MVSTYCFNFVEHGRAVFNGKVKCVHRCFKHSLQHAFHMLQCQPEGSCASACTTIYIDCWNVEI